MTHRFSQKIEAGHNALSGCSRKIHCRVRTNLLSVSDGDCQHIFTKSKENLYELTNVKHNNVALTSHATIITDKRISQSNNTIL